jgi:hypothetical protein
VQPLRLAMGVFVAAAVAAGVTVALTRTSGGPAAATRSTVTVDTRLLLESLTRATRSQFAAGFACNPVEGLAAGVPEPYCTNPTDITVYGDGIRVRTGWSVSAGTRLEARQLCTAVAESVPPVPYLYVRVNGKGDSLLAWSSAAGTRRCSS